MRSSGHVLGTTRPAASRGLRPFLYGALLASGASALIYQVAWVRLLTVLFGATIHAVSTVLAVFMAGLALGSYLGGKWSDRASRPLVVYALLELAIGGYAVAFVLALPHIERSSAWLLQMDRAGYTGFSPLTLAIGFALLLVPTTFIGATFPVVAKIVNDAQSRIGARLGYLYGANAFGAVLGCVLAAGVLFFTVGVRGSILLAAAVNLLIGLAAAWCARFWQPLGCVPLGKKWAGAESPGERPLAESGDVPSLATQVEETRLGHRRGGWWGLAFLCGLTTMACEVLWTRLVVNFLSANVLVFAAILTAFLLGASAGGFLAARWQRGDLRLESRLALLLSLNGLWLVGAVLLESWIGELFHVILQRDLGGGAFGSRPAWCLGALTLLVLLPATSLGAVFPLLFQGAVSRLPTLGGDTGRLYAWNTVGAICGAALSGLCGIALLGVRGSSLVLAALNLLAAGWLMNRPWRRWSWRAAAAACVGLALVPAVRQPRYWLNGGFSFVVQVPPSQIRFLKEGTEATVGVADNYESLLLSVNGLIVAETSRQDLWDLLLKSHLALLIHPAPRQVALVGLGAGVSLGAVEAYDEVEQIECIEISPEVAEAHRLFGDFNRQCWQDPRLRLHINDGRHHLLTTRNRYDVISVDPIDPPVCNLYTRDFFQLCYDRLERGGIMVQWLPLFRLSRTHLQMVMRAFTEVFPESTLWYDGTSLLLMGRREQLLTIDYPQLQRRAAAPKVHASLSAILAPAPHILLATYVCGPEGVARLLPADVPANTDDRPILEYLVLQASEPSPTGMAANLDLFAPQYEESILPRLQDMPPAELLEQLDGARRLMQELLLLRIQALRGEQAAWAAVDQLAEKYRLNPLELRVLEPFLDPIRLEY